MTVIKHILTYTIIYLETVIVDFDRLDYDSCMDDKNLDAYRNKINPDLWRRMKAFCILNNLRIHEFLNSAIELKLKQEDNEN